MAHGRIAILQLVIGAFLISLSAVFVKLAQVGPTVSGFYRMAVAGGILLVWSRLAGHTLFKGWPQTRVALLAGLVFALDLFFWHRSILYIGPGLATLLGNFQVFFLAGFGILILKESVSRRLLAAIPLALAGIYLIVGVDWQTFDAGTRFGIILGVVTALCYATYLLTLRGTQTMSDRLTPMANLAIISLTTMVALGITALVEGESFVIPDVRTGIYLAAYGILCQVLGWVVISRAMPRVDASLTGLILLLQPVLAFVWDVLIFARPVKKLEIVGGVLALAAIYMGTSSRRASRPAVGKPTG